LRDVDKDQKAYVNDNCHNSYYDYSFVDENPKKLKLTENYIDVFR
jgi:hypothetical protein